MKRLNKVTDVFKDDASKFKEHIAVWKRNFWSLVCSRIGFSITEEKRTKEKIYVMKTKSKIIILLINH
jgi:hypothetical protein